MKKTIYYLFLYTISSNYLYAKAPLETQKSQSTAAQQAQQDAKQAQLLAQEAELKKEQAAQEAQKAQKLKELTQKAELLGIQSTIDVINLSGKNINIYGIMQDGTTTQIGAFEQGEIPAQTITVPSGVMGLTIKGSTQKSNSFPLINGLQAITITQIDSIGLNTFKIAPLIPEEGNNLLIYNALAVPHTITLSYHSSKKESSFFDYIKDVTGTKVTFSYTVQPGQACTITIPEHYNDKTITHIKLDAHNKNKESKLIAITDHSSFVLHKDKNDVIVYTKIVPDKN